ncbi:MAG: hypothetical protein AAF573_08130, partial [Bacteroidota bacterium]
MKRIILLTIGIIMGIHSQLFANLIDTVTLEIGKEKKVATHLVKGALNLYAVTEYETDFQYVNNNSINTREIAYENYYLEIDNQLLLVHSGNYKKVIKKYLPNAPELHKRLGKVGFRFDNLLYMIEFYNKFRVEENRSDRVINITPTESSKVGTQSIFDMMNYQEELNVDLIFDTEAVFKDRSNTQDHEALLAFKDENGEIRKWEIKVSLRGKFRRIKCENLPPLKLDFKKKALRAAGLSEFDDMKLVTHCVNDAKEAKRLLAREYLAYKIFNQISEESYRVQFLKINYVDVKTGKETKQYGFLIEDTAQLRDRINATKVEKPYNLPRTAFHTDQVKTVALFQYLIGNTDWSVMLYKNIKIFEKDNLNIIVPYDFDFAAIVEAPYATLNLRLGITHPKQRVYLGFPNDLEDMKATIDLFVQRKKSIVNVVKETTL